MYRRFICLVSFALVFGLASSVQAQKTWDNGDDANNHWNAPDNWDPNGLPTSEDNVDIGGGEVEANYPVVMPGTVAETLDFWCNASASGGNAMSQLTMSGGTLTTSDLMGFGGWGGPGKLIMEAGDVNADEMWIGYNDEGWLTMTGGTILSRNGGWAVCRGDNARVLTAVGEPGGCYIHLDGGTVDCGPFFIMRVRYISDPPRVEPWIPIEFPEDPGWIDITGGTMIINGDARDTILGYYNAEPNGWITAYGIGSQEDGNIVSHERARIVTDFDWRNPDRTTVTAYKADNSEPYDLYPIPYATGVLPTVTLSWKPGDYVAYGGAYAPDPTKAAKMGNGHHVFILEGSGYGDWTLNYPLNTAVGRIVGTQDANTFDIAAVYPGGTLELDTVYAWTVIESNDANAPLGDWWWKAPIHYFTTVGGAASNPSPGDGATVGIKAGAALEVELTWDRGYYAASADGHVVYFGTDFNDVNEATGGTPQTLQSYAATGLELGEEYFWRVDEVNTAGPDPCIWPGNTWSFTVGDYRVVDDFDYASWDDMNDFWQINAADYAIGCSPYGGGAGLALAGGAMVYNYDNNDIIDQYGPLLLDYFSEVRYVFSSPADLTEGDAETTLRALSLDHAGNADNAVDPNYDRMYVALECASDGNIAFVSNPDASAQKKSGNWNIDLDEFIDAGVDVQDVAYLYLGFGIRCNYENPGDEGVVTFDNIRVYPQRCVGQPGYRQDGDLNGDCTVDIRDVKLLSNAWLKTDRLTGVPVAVEDDDPCMMARWEFEGNYLNDPCGRMGSAADGTPYGNPDIEVDETRPQSEAGNQVLYVDGNMIDDTNDYVICGTWGQDGNFVGKSLTLSVWAKQTQAIGWADMISKGESGLKLEFGFVPALERQVHFVGNGVVACPDTKLDLDTWYHIAGTYEKLPDVNGGISRLYIDGRLHEEQDGNEITYIPSNNPNYDPNWCIGAQDLEGLEGDDPPYRPHIDRLYYGYLDDVRVYDKQLSEEEIMWLAGIDSELKNYYAIQPPLSYADIHSPEAKGQKIIDFKDMAKLAQEWLESALWPI